MMEEGQFFLTVLKLIVALTFVLALAYFSLRFGLTRLYAPTGKARYMKVIDQLYLAPKTFLILIQVGEEYYLLTSFNGQVNTVKELAGKPMALEKTAAWEVEKTAVGKQLFSRTAPFLTRFFSKQSFTWRKGK